MERNYWIVMLALLAGGFVGCSDDDGPNWKEAFDEEQANIAEFVKDKSPKEVFEYDVEYKNKKFKDYAYVFNFQTEGKKPEDGQFVLVNYIRKSIPTKQSSVSRVLDASDISLAVGSGVTPLYELGGPVYERVISDDDVFSRCLKYIPEGTKGELILSSLMNGGSYFYCEYKIEKIIDESLLSYENKLMDDYLATVEGDIKGEIISVPLNEGTGKDTVTRVAKILVESEDKPLVGLTDSVTVHYDAYILDEINDKYRVITEMKDDEKVKLNLPSSIVGFAKGLSKLRVGEEAYIVIPSGMGYGFIGFPNPYKQQYIIPPYATLAYKVKVIATKENPKK